MASLKELLELNNLTEEDLTSNEPTMEDVVEAINILSDIILGGEE